MGHLAGALGQPVWILVPKAADWRWMLERERQPLVPDRAAVPPEDHRRLGPGDRRSSGRTGEVRSIQAGARFGGLRRQRTGLATAHEARSDTRRIRSRHQRLHHAARARCGDVPLTGCAVRRRDALPQPRRHAAAQFRPRRIQVPGLSAAGAGRRAARRAVSATRRDRQRVARDAARGGPLSRDTRTRSSPSATRPGRRARRRCCCATARTTSTACTKTSTARWCFRCS